MSQTRNNKALMSATKPLFQIPVKATLRPCLQVRQHTLLRDSARDAGIGFATRVQALGDLETMSCLSFKFRGSGL